jgi:hypothetical protein
MTNYGTLIDNQLHPAPRAVRVGGAVVCNPTPAQYEAAGYLPVVDERPPCEEGYHAVATGWETRDGAIRRVYEAVQDPPPTLADFDAAMEVHLYEERAARGYTTREPDAYLNSSVPRWAQDARDWVAHRDAVMGYALTMMNAVAAGRRDAPTMAEFREGLQTIQWTYTEVN